METTQKPITNQAFWNTVEVFVKEVINKDVVVFQSLIDISIAENLRLDIQKRSGQKPSYTALVVKAISLALRDSPEANCLVLRNRRIPLNDVRAVVAVERNVEDLGQIVLSAHIADSDKLTLTQLTDKLRYYATVEVEDVQVWKDFLILIRKVPPILARLILKLPLISPALWRKWRGGSFAITSPAKYGVDVISGIWPYPLTFAFGLIKERPVAVNGQVVARPTLPLTLAWDRRLMPGAPAARFFNTIVTRLEKAEFEEPL